MTNPLIIPILDYIKTQKSTCSLLDLVKFCQSDFNSLIGKQLDPQVIIFQKNFFVMNALYQIQRDLRLESFHLNIFPLQISLVPNTNNEKNALTTGDSELANYYLDWSNFDNISIEEVDALFASFWLKYHALDQVALALNTLGIDKGSTWSEVRQAYQKQVSCLHPDKGGNAEDFIAIRKAYEVLRGCYKP